MKPSITRTTGTSLVCECGHDVSTVDHLLSGQINSAGWWQCYNCNLEHKLEMRDGVLFSESRICENPYYPVVAVLKSRTIPAIYFIVPTRTHGEASVNAGRYYYEEHTCPVNWIRNTVAIVKDGKFVLTPGMSNVAEEVVRDEDDNHGFYELVAMKPAIPLYEQFDLKYDVTKQNHGVNWCKVGNDGMWSTVFPEAFSYATSHLTADMDRINIAGIIAITNASPDLMEHWQRNLVESMLLMSRDAYSDHENDLTVDQILESWQAAHLNIKMEISDDYSTWLDGVNKVIDAFTFDVQDKLWNSKTT